jgi:hypothetical protein
VWSTPSTDQASTCGWGAACRPTPWSRSDSASGCPAMPSRTCGRGSSRSTATTATAACETGHA